MTKLYHIIIIPCVIQHCVLYNYNNMTIIIMRSGCTFWKFQFYFMARYVACRGRTCNNYMHLRLQRAHDRYRPTVCIGIARCANGFCALFTYRVARVPVWADETTETRAGTRARSPTAPPVATRFHLLYCAARRRRCVGNTVLHVRISVSLFALPLLALTQ